LDSSRRPMTIDISVPCDLFANRLFSERDTRLDLQASSSNFAHMLESGIAERCPGSEVTVRLTQEGPLRIALDGTEIGLNDSPSADRTYVVIRMEMDKLFFYGQFWVDRR